MMGDLTKNFDSTEFASHFRGVTTQVPQQLWHHLQRLANNLQVLRDAVGRPIGITSGYRTVRHNEAVGGAKGSQHLDAAAADFYIAGLTADDAYCLTAALIKDGKMREGGLGAYATHTHYDPRGTISRWTKGVPVPDCSEVVLPAPPRPPAPPKKEGNLTEAQERVAQLFAQATLLATHGQPLPATLKRQLTWLLAQ